MVRILWCLGLVAVALVSGHEYADDWYQTAIDKDIKDEGVNDGTDAIFKFLGFKCPKGHRCLPVLECIPCDYGTYKSNEGSDLCKNCPSGCTTLRKGAESWKECVPKCPPGYEESECGKTCTKCRAGYYKSNWKNKMCNKCPMSSKWNRNMVGLKKKSQCYQSTLPECHSYTGDLILALDASGSVSEDDFTRQLQAVNDFIEAFDVTEKAEATRFAVFTFCAQVGEVIHFDDYSDKTELQNAVNGLRWMGGVKNISLALDFIRNNLAYSAGNRQGVLDAVIVTVNGMSPASSWTIHSAESLKSIMPVVIAVGIGEVLPTEMSSIASNDDLIVLVDNTEELARQLPELTKDACVYNIEELARCIPELTKDACELFKTAPEDPISKSTMTTKSTTQGGDRCYQKYGTCSVEQHDDVRLKMGLEGTNCQYFCQCAPASTTASGYGTYHWVEHMCAPGTLFDESLPAPGCNHYYSVDCTDTGPSTLPVTALTTTTPEPTDSYGCIVGDMCTQNDYAIVRLKPLFGSGCKQFCQCAHDEGSAGTDVTYYWERHTCANDTLFDTSLKPPLCNHEDQVSCDGYPPYTTIQPNDGTSATETTPVPTPSDGDLCYATYGTCNQTVHDNLRLEALAGVDCLVYCHCATKSTQSDGTITYYWQEKTCAPGTIFDNALKVCVDATLYTCADESTPSYTTSGPNDGTTTHETTTPGPTASDGDLCYETYGSCNQTDYDNVRHEALEGVECLVYCHCATESIQSDGTITYYWEEKMCATGTIFDNTHKVCVDATLNTCADAGSQTTIKQTTTAQTTTESPDLWL